MQWWSSDIRHKREHGAHNAERMICPGRSKRSSSQGRGFQATVNVTWTNMSIGTQQRTEWGSTNSTGDGTWLTHVIMNATYWSVSSLTISCWPHMESIGSTIPLCLDCVWKLPGTQTTVSGVERTLARRASARPPALGRRGHSTRGSDRLSGRCGAHARLNIITALIINTGITVGTQCGSVHGLVYLHDDHSVAPK